MFEIEIDLAFHFFFFFFLKYTQWYCKEKFPTMHRITLTQNHTSTVHMHLLPLTSLPFPLDSLFLTFRRKPEEEESFVGEMQGLSVPVPEGDCGLESSVVLLEVLTGRAVSGSCFWPLAVWEMTGKDRLSCSDLLRCGGPGNSSSSA